MMSVPETSVGRYGLAALAQCERAATALTYIMVLGLVALGGSLAFAQFGDSVRAGIRAETNAAKEANGADVDGPTGSLATEVAHAGAEQLVVQGSWALAAKAGTRGMASARRSNRGRGAVGFSDPKRERGGDPAPNHPSPAKDNSPPPPGSPRPPKDEPTPNGTCSNGQCKPGEGTRCFVAGTAVATPFGPRPIEQIVPGDIVLSRDQESGEFSERSVAATFITLDAPLVEVRTVSAPDEVVSVRATPGHLFWTVANSWVRADQLVSGDALANANDREVRVLSVEAVADRATVYNFEVEGTHTYFVGPTSLWVHNMTAGEDAWRKGTAEGIELLGEDGKPIDLSKKEPLAEYLKRHAEAGNTLAVDAYEASVDRMVEAEIKAMLRAEDERIAAHPDQPRFLTEELQKELRAEIKQDRERMVADARTTLAAHHDVKEVPKQIHLVWIGKAMKPSAVENVGAWGEKAKGTPYESKVTLWMDEATLKNLEHAFTQDAQGKKRSQADILRDKGVNIRTDVRNQLSGEMQKHFDAYVGTKNYHLLSDISRYGILEKHGGTYLDVDIAPGAINLNQPAPKMSTNDVPAFGPLFRTEEDWAKSVAATKKFGYRSGKQKAADAIDHMYNHAGLGNHFIIAPQGSSFLNALNERIAADLDNRIPKEVARHDAALISGPSAIAPVQEDFIRNNGVGIIESADHGYVHGIKRHEKDKPNWTTVKWVTPESNNLGFNCD